MRKVYDLTKPHCDEARKYKQVPRTKQEAREIFLGLKQPTYRYLCEHR